MSIVAGTANRTTFWPGSGSPRAPELEGKTCADVAIIGGGFAGLSCARFLREADPSLDIALLEREHVGYGASGRNGGILSPFLPMAWLIDCSSSPRRLEEIRFAARFIAEQIQSLAQLIRREAIPCDLRPTEIITTGAAPLHQSYLRVVAERCRLAGIPGRAADPGELQEAVPYPVRSGFVLEAHTVQPLALAEGLRGLIRRAGVRLYESTRVTSVRPAKGRVEILTGTGARLHAGKAIIATNAYTNQLECGASRGFPRPIITYLLATAPLEQSARSRLGLEQRTWVDIGSEYFYARMHEARLLFGGIDRASPTAESAPVQDEPCYARLRLELIRRFPFLRDAPVDGFWRGPYHEARTQAPIIGTVKYRPDVILNIGYGGVGLTLSQLSGRMAAGLVLGGRHRDPESDRMREICAATGIPWWEGTKLGLRIARSLMTRR